MLSPRSTRPEPHNWPVESLEYGPPDWCGVDRAIGIPALLLGAAVILLGFIAIAALTPDIASSHGSTPLPPLHHARTAGAHPHRTQWVRAGMSHYGTSTRGDHSGDQYLGQRTSCGKTVTTSSRFVAALKPGLAHCHMKLTLLYHGHRYYVTVEDRGAWRKRKDDRVLDAAPGLRRLLGFHGVARIQYVRGWTQ